VAGLLAGAKPVLAHGDLAGDNLMVTADGRLAIADWGAARISTGLTDAASLAVYVGWSPEARRGFYDLYLSDGRTAGDSVGTLELLSRLLRYRLCIQSLVWLKEDADGLDAIGQAFLETQVQAL
jgi:thiamine kinase-like enzyme